MKIQDYIFQSLRYFRKQHLAIFAGTIIGAAVLTGALVVGDSVSYSLKYLVDVRLGNISFALQTGDRFVEARLAKDLAADLEKQVEPVLLLDGFGINPAAGLRVNSVQVAGIDSSFGQFYNTGNKIIAPGEAMISKNLGDKLELKVGDDFLLRVEDVNVIPLNTPFSQEGRASVGIRLKVKKILQDEEMGRFNLKSNQAAPYNVFLDREFLAGYFELAGLANTLLVAGESGDDQESSSIQKALERNWQAGDMGLKINRLESAGQIEIESGRIFIDGVIVEACKKNFLETDLILTYLVNTFRTPERSAHYSFVSAASTNFDQLEIAEDEIIINDWLADDLSILPGSELSLDYFVVGPLRNLDEKERTFRVKSIVETGVSPADSTLMPAYPGLSEANNCSDWDTGIPIDLNKIRDKDEDYWDEYKGTPKALISFQTAKSLWQNDFGAVTAIRIQGTGLSLEEVGEKIAGSLSPSELNLVFQPVYGQGLQAANNSVDFGELFLSLSFFVIVAAILLIVLLFNLHAESRMKEAGILSALGFSKRAIVRYRFLESVFVALGGGILGALLGIGYNYLLISGLNSVWNDAVHTDVLLVFVKPSTLITGAMLGSIIALLSVYLITTRKMKDPLISLINKQKRSTLKSARLKRRLGLIIGISFLVLCVLLVSKQFLFDSINDPANFLSSGALFITGCIFLFSHYLNRNRWGNQGHSLSFINLALLNARRNRFRSITIVILFALGAFTIIITGANRKSFYGVENEASSGTGGFLFWAETAMGIPVDLQSAEGRETLNLSNDNEAYNVSFIQMPALDGDDASCLNLNQVQQPRILGIDPNEMHKRGAFSFSNLIDNEKKLEPWTSLSKHIATGIIPAIADQTVITWGLKMKVGDTLHYRNEAGQPIKLLLVGGLQNSIFQGNVLIDVKHFRENFPSISGSKVFLVDAPPESGNELSESLNMFLADYGIELSSTKERLALFNSVENTYLSVFMILGGLGVLIGTIGLGIVLLRSMLDRKQELALMSSLGFQKKQLVKLTFMEYLLLLSVGMIIGTIGAFFGILPSILSPAFVIPGNFIFWILLLVFTSGLIWIWIPARQIVKMPVVPALREE